MDYDSYLVLLAKEFKGLSKNNTVDRDTCGQVVIELLNDDFSSWVFYITPHEGQFAGIQHDFTFDVVKTDVGIHGYHNKFMCTTTTCHPNVAGPTSIHGRGKVCITMDDNIKSLMGYANMLLWLMINPDYSNPFLYESRIVDRSVVSCFNEAQIDRYYRGKVVPIIMVGDKLVNDHYREKGANFKMERGRAVPVRMATGAVPLKSA